MAPGAAPDALPGLRSSASLLLGLQTMQWVSQFTGRVAVPSAAPDALSGLRSRASVAAAFRQYLGRRGRRAGALLCSPCLARAVLGWRASGLHADFIIGQGGLQMGIVPPPCCLIYDGAEDSIWDYTLSA